MDALDPANVKECILERLGSPDKEPIRDGSLVRRLGRQDALSGRAPRSTGTHCMYSSECPRSATARAARKADDAGQWLGHGRVPPPCPRRAVQGSGASPTAPWPASSMRMSSSSSARRSPPVTPALIMPTLLANKSAEHFVAATDRVLSAVDTVVTWIACASEHGSARSCSSCPLPAWWPD